MSGGESAHAVAHQHDALRVDIPLYHHVGRMGTSNDRVHILQRAVDAELAFRPERAAIMESEHGPAGPPHCLRQIEILFVSWQTVRQDHQRKRPATGRAVDDAIHHFAVALALDRERVGGMRRVGRRIDTDRTGDVGRLPTRNQRQR